MDINNFKREIIFHIIIDMTPHTLIHTRPNGCMVWISVQCQVSTKVKTDFLYAVCVSTPSDELQCAYTINWFAKLIKAELFLKLQ